MRRMRSRIQPVRAPLLPIVLLASAFAAGPVAPVRAAAPAVTNRFEAEIRAMARRDATNPPPAEPILFAGSSSIRLMKIAVIPMKPSIRRWAHWYEMNLGNARIAEHCAAAGVDVIDDVTPMLGPDGLPRPELFAADKLHMNDAGYRIWTRLVTDWLARQGIRPTPSP